MALELGKKLKRIKTKFIIGFIVVLIFIISIMALIIGFNIEEPKLTVVPEAKLKELIEINELSTLEFIYNSIVNVGEGDDIRYYVAYEGTVRYGMDAEQIQITTDGESKEIRVWIPEIKVMECIVNPETIDFIFTKDKYETETVLTEAYGICKADLEEKVAEDDSLIGLAGENAVAAMEALLKPWVEQLDGEYKLIMEQGGCRNEE